ncbi:MAG: folylpolyglutamate synthase/dihydrofolate synthase family protein [Armatimonadota bacterium]|nr:folylpolyglutamate synthase/dihydrofolate synthase family protein [Armatimonadota bacterium]
MTYHDALAYLGSLLEGRRPHLGPDDRLARMARLLATLDLARPSYPVVLVAGTKGKGSTSTMLAAILAASGRRPGLYTKPHVSDFRERIRVGGEMIGEEHLAALVAGVAPAVEAAGRAGLGRPTYFEVSLALALRCFCEQAADAAVVEVGIGGRYDAANVLDPAVSVITPISRDHTDLLGDSLASIAAHKAGVMRPGRPVVVAPQVPEVDGVVAARAVSVGARLIRVAEVARWLDGGRANGGHRLRLEAGGDYGWMESRLRGPHQVINAATAVVAAEAFLAPAPLPRDAVAAGLQAAVLPGRFEVLDGQPPLVLDVAHNAAAMEALRASLDVYFPRRPLVVVFGMLATHDAASAVPPVAGRARLVVVTEPPHLRAIGAPQLAEVVRGQGPEVVEVPGPVAALARAEAEARAGEVLCVTGSVYLVGAVRERALAARRREASRRVG